MAYAADYSTRTYKYSIYSSCTVLILYTVYSKLNVVQNAYNTRTYDWSVIYFREFKTGT